MENKGSYKSRQAPGGPAPFASFEDLSDCIGESSPEEIDPLPGIREEPSTNPHEEDGSDVEREFLQRNRELSVTFGFGEGVSTYDLSKSAEELDPAVKHTPSRLNRLSTGSISGAVGTFQGYNFRMIDAASEQSLMDLDLRRRTTGAIGVEEGRMAEGGAENPSKQTRHRTGSPEDRPMRDRIASITSAGSGANRSNSPHTMAIETSFCGGKPIPTPSMDLAGDNVSLASSEDGPERDLIEEINRRTQFPITKQDSYSHAIYHGTKSRRNVRKQGSYEQAVESGVTKDIAMRRTKRILKYRKQDSYQRAIGGSFEDEHSLREERKSKEMSTRIRKQESYLKAVGEVSPDTESKDLNSQTDKEISFIRKQDSYVEAIRRSRSPLEDEDGPGWRSSVLGALLEDNASEKPKFRLGDDDQTSIPHVSARLGVCIPPTTNINIKMKKQDSYTMAIEESSDEDYIDKEINRKIALKRTESVKTVVKECINENEDILFRIKRRTKKEQEALDRLQMEQNNALNKQTMLEDSNANINTIDNGLCKEPLETIMENKAAVVIQAIFKGYRIRKEIGELRSFYCNMSEDGNEENVILAKNDESSHGLKRRQDSYLEAIASPPESIGDEPEPKKRSWKKRQESYQAAIGHEQEENLNQTKPDWKNRQNSYLQAVGTSIEVTSPNQNMPSKIKTRQESYQMAVGTPVDITSPNQNRAAKIGIRQDSYQQAVETSITLISPNNKVAKTIGTRQDSYQEAVQSEIMSPDHKVDGSRGLGTRQASYQQAIEGISGNSLLEVQQPSWKNRQDSYQKALDSDDQDDKKKKGPRQDSYQQAIDSSNILTATIEMKMDKKNSKDKSVASTTKSESKTSDKTPKQVSKKQSKSPRRRAEAYQRPKSTSSEEEEVTVQPKRAHKSKMQKKDNKGSDQEIAVAKGISKFSEAADVLNAAIKIQSAYRGFKAREEIREHHDSIDIPEEALPIKTPQQSKNVKSSAETNVKKKQPKKHRAAWADVVEATITIQRAYRRYHKRKILKEIGVDDVENAEKAIIRIQSQFKGFQTRKIIQERKPVLEKHTAKIVEKPKPVKPKKVIHSTTGKKTAPSKTNNTKAMGTSGKPLKIVSKPVNSTKTTPKKTDHQQQKPSKQILVKKEQTVPKREEAKRRPLRTATYTVEKPTVAKAEVKAEQEDLPDLNSSEVKDATLKIQSAYRGFRTRKELEEARGDLPDLNAADVAAATVKIQAAFKGYKARKMVREHMEILPDLNCAQVQDATLKIQSAYRGFKTRKELKEAGEDLPDLNCADVAAATVKIQAAFKGYKARKMVKEHKEILPDLNCAQVKDATLKIQSAYRGFRTRKELRDAEGDLPDLNAADVAAATIKIQAAFKGYKARKSMKVQKDELPDLKCAKVQDATMKIQSAYRGFKTRKDLKEADDELPDLNAADVAAAAIKIQSAYKGFKARRMVKTHKEILPDLNCAQVQDATLKIQSAYRGFKTRKELKDSGDDLPDLNAADVVAATIKIQSAFKGYKTRKMVQEHKEILPDLNCAQVQDATLKIQSAYRGFKTRKELKEAGDDLPDLNAADVAAATIKIQAAFKGYKARKMVKEHKEILPDLNCAQVQDATLKIQSVYRGFKTRKELKEAGEDLPDLNAADVAAATVKIQAAFKGYKARKILMQEKESLPNLDCAQVKDATLKIQSAYRGFKTRKELKEAGEELPDLNAADVAAATLKIQSAFKGYKARKMIREHKEVLPNLNCAKVQDATLKIQSAYRGFKTRKELKEAGEDLPDLKAADVAAATLKIQSVYKGYKARKMIKAHKEILPDLNCAQVQDATLKIQSAYRGFKTRKELKEAGEELPDLNAADVAAATIKIQAAFKGYKARKMVKEHKEILPDLNCAQVQDATLKIQSAYRGFKTRKDLKNESDDLPDLKAADVIAATTKIQAAFKGYKTRKGMKEKEILPDLNCLDVQNATIKIQSAYRGFKTRKELKESGEDLPDLKAADVAAATIKIQSAYKVYKARKMIKAQKDILPDLNCAEVKDATLKIQSAYRGFKTRKELKEAGQDLPDLNAADVAAAALKIQSVFKGYQARKRVQQQKEILQDLNSAELQDASIRIQSAYRGFKTRKELRAAGDDLPDLKAADVAAATIKIQAAFKGYKARKMLQTQNETLPDLSDDNVKDATLKIQSAYRGFKTRKELKESAEDLPDLNAADVAAATVKIQAAFKGYKARKAIKHPKEDLPDLNCSDVKDAALKIQSAYRGFKTRKELKDAGEELPDLKAADVAAATIKIQAAFKGYKARKDIQLQKEILPDLRSAEVQDAAIKIQSAYKGFKTRREMKECNEDLPDLTAPDLARAALRIQAYYRGFKVRQAYREQNARQQQVSKTLEAAALMMKLSEGSPNQKKKFSRMPLTPSQSIDISSEDILLCKRTQQSKRAEARKSNILAVGDKASKIQVISPVGQRVKKSLPNIVDERDMKKKPRKLVGIPTSVVKEDKSGEFAHHPADVVLAAITIQRFFRKVKERQTKARTSSIKKKKSAEETESDSSSYDTSEDDQEDNSDDTTSSETDSQLQRKRPQSSDTESEDSLPNLEDANVEKAAIKIQSAFKGYKTRKDASKVIEKDLDRKTAQPVIKVSSSDSDSNDGSLPDLADSNVEKAAIKIQSVFKGFQIRKGLKEESEQKGKVSKERTSVSQTEQNDELPDLNDKDLEDAAIKIQSVFKGFQTRKKVTRDNNETNSAQFNVPDILRKTNDKNLNSKVKLAGDSPQKPVKPVRSGSSDTEEELPDLNDADVQKAAVKIQSAFKGFKVRKEITETSKDNQERIAKKAATSSDTESESQDLPDLNDSEVEKAAVKIQSVFKGFQARKNVSKAFQRKATGTKAIIPSDSSDTESENDSLPDLEDSDVERAAVKIQSAFKGFQARKDIRKQKRPVKSLESRDSDSSETESEDDVIPDSENEMSENDTGDDETNKGKTAINKSHSKAKASQIVDIVSSAVVIQKAYRKYKARNATVAKSTAIRSSDEGKQAKQKLKLSQSGRRFADMVSATVLLQRWWRKCRRKRQQQTRKYDMYDYVNAAVTIQRAFRVFNDRRKLFGRPRPVKKTRGEQKKITVPKHTKKRIDSSSDESLPDLESEEVQSAAVLIQKTFKGFKVRQNLKEKEAKKDNSSSDESLPDLEAKEVQDAALLIQKTFKGFKVRQNLKQAEARQDDSSSDESLPDLESKDVQDAALLIQRTFKGFKVRKDLHASKTKGEEESLPDLKSKEVQDAALLIQKTFKGFKVRKDIDETKAKQDDSSSDESLPDLESKEVQDAALLIQKTFKGFQVRKTMKKDVVVADVSSSDESLPDLESKEVQDAAVLIQKTFKGFKVRQSLKEERCKSEESLPDLESEELEKAAVMIQKTFKGFQARKNVKKLEEDDDLPDLKDSEVQNAAILIQKVYRGFQTRKEFDEKKDIVCDTESVAAALKIQSAFKGNKAKTIFKVPMTPQPSIDFENLPPSDSSGSSVNSAKRVPPVPTRFDSKQKTPENVSTSKRVPKKSGASETPKSPLPVRSNRLKEVSIPKVPQKSDDAKQPGSSDQPTNTGAAPPNEPSGFIQQTLLRKESLQNFFKKQGDTPSPGSPSESLGEKSITKTFRDASDTLRRRQKDGDKKPVSSLPKGKEEQKSKIGGFFSSMFNKNKPKEPAPVPESNLRSIDSITDIEFKFNDKVDSVMKPVPKTVSSSSDTESAGSQDKVSRQNSKDEHLNGDKKRSTKEIEVKGRPVPKKETEKSRNGEHLKSAKDSKGTEEEEDELKKDLIHVVLTAVEENWLNQAPKPTLDKVKALQAQDSDPELENSERSTSEADYVKKKLKAQKSKDLESDDEGAQLCKQESMDGELPYVETTLPQERSGTVTISSAKHRSNNECKISSIDRPRSLGQKKQGKLEDYVHGQKKAVVTRQGSDSKITVRLPRQGSKSKVVKGKTVSEPMNNGASSQKCQADSRKIASKSKEVEKKTHYKKDWVDCEKLPETKKSIKKYSTETVQRKTSDGSETSIQTPSGTQIVSPEECSCDCHHDTPPRILSPKPTTSTRPAGTGAKPKTNPRTSSVTARTKPIPSLKSKDSSGAIKSSSSKVSSKSVAGTAKKSSPPPVPVRTTSVSKTPVSSDREVSTNTRVVRDGSGRIVEKTVTKTTAVRRRDTRPRDAAKRSSALSSDGSGSDRR